MERKIGETFEFEGKTYKVVKFNGCGNCAFRYNDCPDLGPVIGNCMDLVRSDGIKVMFEETENMGIKDNKLTINIPEGMEIDILNSNFSTGVICFKKKKIKFKDGDILYAEKDESHTDAIFILKTVKGKRMYYACLILHPYMVCKYSCGGIGNKTLRYATEEEKQQLFYALAKENKAWDAEHKMIVGLKPKIELKPFDKVLVRNRNTQRWYADLFGFKSSDGVNIFYHCVSSSWNFCVPYIGNESLLGTTKDVEG